MVDPISLEIFKNLLASVAEEMGATLGRTAYSPNIKERKDFSCALFDSDGRMVAQAAHIPVHLGAMPLSVQWAIKECKPEPGDTAILNDPYMGGTHLPDITMVSCCELGEEEKKTRKMRFYLASRAHHSDVGGMSPGSMPMSSEVYQEGIIIPPLRLIEAGKLNNSLLSLICRNSRTPEERRGDLAAQLAAHNVGQRRLEEIVARYGVGELSEHMQALLSHAERLTRQAIAAIPDGIYEYADYLDDDGKSPDPVKIAVHITVRGEELEVSFAGSSPETEGCVNAVLAVTQSAVYYVVRCLVGEDCPVNQGTFAPVRVVAPAGTVVNPNPPRAVAGGNVETSQRIVDALFGALALAVPDSIPAASQGTMNNLSLGGMDALRGRFFAYYETIGGGAGASPGGQGMSGVHTHMTNTQNTPVEALESALPLRVKSYSLRRESGGKGKRSGGEGIRRDIEFLVPTTVTILSERRRFAPYGLRGGAPGAKGENVLIRGEEETVLPPKVTITVQPGDILSIRTPGGGGWGPNAAEHNEG